MRWMKKIERLGRRLFRLKAEEAELDEEVRFHIEMLTEEFKATGLNEAEARKAALREFGNVESTLEACRTNWWGFRLLDDLAQDIRFGLQQMWKHKGYTLISILTLGICLAANLTSYTLLRSKLLDPFNIEDSERVVAVGRHIDRVPEHSVLPLSASDYRFIEEHAESFSHIGFGMRKSVYMATDAGVARIFALQTSAGLWETIRVQPFMGRMITQVDIDQAAPVALIAYEIWQKRFGGTKDIIGKDLRIDEQEYSVIGVMPKGFSLGINKATLWIGASPFSAEELEAGGSLKISAYARLKDGVSMLQAQNELSRLFQIHAESWGERGRKKVEHYGIDFTLASPNQVFPASFRFIFFSVQAITLLVLLVGGLNICGMLLVQGYVRRMEYSMRRVMGAGLPRIIRQVVTEILILCFLGLLLALPLTQLGMTQLSGIFPWGREAEMDLHVLLVSVGGVFLFGLVVALQPILEACGGNLNKQLHAAGRTVSGRKRNHRIRGSFLVVQIALSLILVIGAGIYALNARSLARKDLGFNPEGVVTVSVGLPEYRFEGSRRYWGKTLPFLKQMTRELEQIPGVLKVGRGVVPLSVSYNMDSFKFSNQESDESIEVQEYKVSPGFFSALQIPIYGRGFQESDTGKNQKCAVVSRTFADAHFPGEDPVGKELLRESQPNRPLLIVGVAEEMHYMQRFSKQPEYTVYTCDAQWRSNIKFGSFLIRVDGDPDTFIPVIRERLRAFDPHLYYRVSDLKSRVGESVKFFYFPMMVCGVFSLLALFLTVVGLYGLLSHTVTERRKEFGIRLALGESRGSIAKRVVRSSALLAMGGLFVGLALAYLICAKINPQLGAYDTTRPGLFITVALFMLLVIALSTMVPTLRAVNANIAQALRDE